MTNEDEIKPSNFLLYSTDDGKVNIDVLFSNESVWLTQQQMCQLFDTTKQNISLHIQNIFSEGELVENSVVKESLTTANDGKKYKTNFYNLDVIISVGYRVKSIQGTRFRIWATQRLREYIIKGFTLDDERLKNGPKFGKDYFKELLERIRSIRASERRIYQQITDIFAECSTDYDPQSEVTRDFFATVQNRFHFAITGHTAAEIIHDKSDSEKPYMGLTTWKNALKGRILSSDVIVAKNYLSEEEIKKLERIISGFFDYVENIIENRQTFTMAEFANSVNKFLSFNEYKVLEDKGKISKKDAEKKALSEYAEYNKHQPIESDFDKETRKYLKGEKDNGENA